MDVIRLYRKAFVVNLLGGVCQFCGYKRTLRNLAFHHVYTKTLDLSARHFQHRLDRLLPELQKCVLCCHNCHGEIHEGLIKLKKVQECHRKTKRALAALAGHVWKDFALNWKSVRLIKKSQLTAKVFS